jgi:hypothetical protein
VLLILPELREAIVARLRGRIAPELVYYALAELEAKGSVMPAETVLRDAAFRAWWAGRGIARARAVRGGDRLP